MAKGADKGLKEKKKEPTKTLKEKRDEKKAKKEKQKLKKPPCIPRRFFYYSYPCFFKIIYK